MQGNAAGGKGLTLALAAQALELRYEALPDDVRLVARDCLTDWLACALAAVRDPVTRIALALAVEEGGAGGSTIVGHPHPATLSQAALVNGAMSHVLDYDDVNLQVPGHLSVAILPALLALSESRKAAGDSFLSAFVAGYEFACRVGALLEPAHYANGFHATATIGSLGVAVACAHLLRLDAEQTAHAIGTAATQAAGLKCMFGTMAKPLHAGLASQAGLRAALLASKGFKSRNDALECNQGFAQTHGSDFFVEKAWEQPAHGYHLLNNLFKFHAACYSTHATIEAIGELRRAYELTPSQVQDIHVLVGEGCRICDLQNPRTELEAKFSLRAAAAFALLDMPTSELACWARVGDAKVAQELHKVRTELVPTLGLSDAVVSVRLNDGRSRNRHMIAASRLWTSAHSRKRCALNMRLWLILWQATPCKPGRWISSTSLAQKTGRQR